MLFGYLVILGCFVRFHNSLFVVWSGQKILDIFLRLLLIKTCNLVVIYFESGPKHLGLKTGPLCPMFYTKLKEPCSFTKVPDGSCPNILRVQKRRNPAMYVCLRLRTHSDLKS